MSRIQDILSKAERDGTARRTRTIVDEYAARPAEPPVAARARTTGDEPRPAVDAPQQNRSPESWSRPAAVEPARPAPTLGDAARLTRPARQVSPVAPEPRIRFTEPTVTPEPGAPQPGTTTVEPARVLPELDQHLVAALAPASLAAEQYRSLRTRLKRAEGGRSLRAIAVTSPAKGDGKSLTAANLALTMAQEFQQRVLLIDADLRRPTVHRLFGLAETPGLADVLLNAAELDEALVTLPDHHLAVLPAGMPPTHPAELLGSTTMRRVLDILRTRFDRILIDVPPVAPLADVHILAPMVDGLLMIVRAGITPKPAIERALAGLEAGKVLGLVLNETGNEGTDSYNYEGYGYIAG